MILLFVAASILAETVAITPVAAAEPSLLITSFNRLPTPGIALKTLIVFDDEDTFPVVI